MAELRESILKGEEITGIHKAWFEAFGDGYDFTEENTEDILHREIGNTFVKVLKDAGVYKDTDEGLDNFLKFIEFVNQR
jgi:UDPglucose--hexose-1-phosphate uridylyltransferase